MITNENDRRTRKTVKAIQEALFSLMQEKQYGKTTIQNIIDRADVGRSTFYSHFQTKDELLISCIENLLEIVKQFVVSYFESNGDKSKVISVVNLFEHIKENSRIIKGLLNSEGADLFFGRIQDYCNEGIDQYLSSKFENKTELKVPRAILTNHISSTLISLLKWWLKSNMPYTPLQMDDYFQELIAPSIKSIMNS